MLEQILRDKKTGEVVSAKNVSLNSDFVMLFKSNMPAIRKLAKEDGKAFSLFNLIVEKMDKANALIASIKVLAEFEDCSERTIKEKVRVLKDRNFLTVLKSGTSNVYVVNADIAWTSHANRKEYAKFRAEVLLSKEEQDNHLKEKEKFKTEGVRQLLKNEKKQKEGP